MNRWTPLSTAPRVRLAITTAIGVVCVAIGLVAIASGAQASKNRFEGGSTAVRSLHFSSESEDEPESSVSGEDLSTEDEVESSSSEESRPAPPPCTPLTLPAAPLCPPHNPGRMNMPSPPSYPPPPRPVEESPDTDSSEGVTTPVLHALMLENFTALSDQWLRPSDLEEGTEEGSSQPVTPVYRGQRAKPYLARVDLNEPLMPASLFASGDDDECEYEYEYEGESEGEDEAEDKSDDSEW